MSRTAGSEDSSMYGGGGGGGSSPQWLVRKVSIASLTFNN